MHAESTGKNLKAIEAWANQLACPACLGDLRFTADRATCLGCGRAYPIEDGIPVLIIERATAPSR
jgi:uncharacterized protein